MPDASADAAPSLDTLLSARPTLADVERVAAAAGIAPDDLMDGEAALEPSAAVMEAIFRALADRPFSADVEGEGETQEEAEADALAKLEGLYRDAAQVFVTRVAAEQAQAGALLKPYAEALGYQGSEGEGKPIAFVLAELPCEARLRLRFETPLGDMLADLSIVGVWFKSEQALGRR